MVKCLSFTKSKSFVDSAFHTFPFFELLKRDLDTNISRTYHGK